VFSDSNSFLVIRLALTSVAGCLVFIFMEPLALEWWNLFVEGPGLGSRNFVRRRHPFRIDARPPGRDVPGQRLSVMAKT
jgi:hypothetical protein